MPLIALFLTVLLSSSLSSAYIPPGRVLLSKLSENNGAGSYQIDQDVHFTIDGERFSVRETWYVENENALRVDVQGLKALKGQIKLSFVYKNGTRFSSSQFSGNQKWSADFFERFFHVRQFENWTQYLTQNKMAGPSLLTKKPFVKDQKYVRENFLRLSRCSGVVCYAFGQPTPTESEELTPGLWIEQDQFLIRKFRLPSQAEIEANNYNDYAKNLHFPRQRTVRWDNKTVEINLISIHNKLTATQISQLINTTTVENSQAVLAISTPAAQQLIEEFYKRFR